MFDSTTAKVALATPPAVFSSLPTLCFELLTSSFSTFQRSNLQTRMAFTPTGSGHPGCVFKTCQCVLIYPLSFHILAHSFAFFCTFLHSPETQPFSFQSFPHSLQKTPGGGGYSARAPRFAEYPPLPPRVKK